MTLDLVYDETELSVVPASFVFNGSNWDTAQNFRGHRRDRRVAEGDEISMISHTTSSADTPFDGLIVDDVDVEIINADELQISIEGPTVGAPGVEATFEAIQNASGTGEVTYQWNLLKDFVDTGISGDEADLQVHPDRRWQLSDDRGYRG